MAYSTESGVYDFSGLSSSLVQGVTGKTEAQVSTLVTSLIAKADQRVKKWIRVPIVVRRERHVADGEKRIFELGPEDTELELYDYTSQQGVEEVFAVYEEGKRLKHNYPKDCDFCENNSSDWTGSNCTITDVANSVASLNVGDYHLQGVFSAAGYMEHPDSQDLNKNIHAWDYITLILQTDDASVTFTLRLYDIDGNANYYEFTLPKADRRYCVSVLLDGFSGSVSWEDTPMYYFRLYASAACTVKLDGLCFNNGYVWTYPYGELIHVETPDITTREGDDGVLGDGTKLHVTYSFDPFKQSTPANIESASARLAGAFLWDYLTGYVLADSKLRLSGETLEPMPPRDVMLVMKKRLIEEAKQDVAEYGFGYVGGCF